MGIRQEMVSRLARNGEHEKQRASIKGLQIGSPQAIDSDGLLLALLVFAHRDRPVFRPDRQPIAEIGREKNSLIEFFHNTLEPENGIDRVADDASRRVAHRSRRCRR